LTAGVELLAGVVKFDSHQLLLGESIIIFSPTISVLYLFVPS
jgi:hypothetical protein